MPGDRVPLAHRRHEPNDHRWGGPHPRQQVPEDRSDHHAQQRRNTGARQQWDPCQQDEPANTLGVREGVPERPEPTSRRSGERERLQLQHVSDLIDEFDGCVAVPVPGNAEGIAQPEARAIHIDRPHTLELGEQRKVGKRGRPAAMQQNAGSALTCLDEMDAAPRGSSDVAVPDPCVGEDSLVDIPHFVRVSDTLQVELIGSRLNGHLATAFSERLALTRSRKRGLAQLGQAHEPWPDAGGPQSPKSELCVRCRRCENLRVAATDIDDYCAFSKAVEHLGDRWSLPILAQLVLLGPRSFSELASGLPGHVSRSVLADKLRKLEQLGLISRENGGRRPDPYRLTVAGNDLAPTILSLQGWADAWLPDDVAMVERDPEIVFGWLTKRIDVAGLPERQAIVEVTMRHERGHRCWLVLERGTSPYGCFEDPLLDESRYVYVEAGITVLLALARGRRSWVDAVADGSVAAFGNPDLIRQIPFWFKSVEQSKSVVPDRPASTVAEAPPPA
jgi:DNA-binding HxlR family transcriptional regulator